LLSRKSGPTLSPEQLAELWRLFKENTDTSLREQLVEVYLPMVRSLATGILRKMRPGFDVDDLIADGSVGLVKAIEGFDLERGFKFQTYATPVIRGAIFNGLRRMDWVPERTRNKARALQQAIDRLHAISGEEPTEQQLADELKISTEEVFDLIANLSSVYLLSLEQPLGSDGDGHVMLDVIEDGESNPQMEVEFAEERKLMRAAINRLDGREKKIITKHYFEGVTLEAISRELGVTKQRVSQMHSRAVRRLREFMGEEGVSSEAMQNFLFDGHA
jgi:RNA polymerase sigma factor for flagellar operon FliA